MSIEVRGKTDVSTTSWLAELEGPETAGRFPQGEGI